MIEPDVLALFEALGIVLGLDWDETVLTECPETIPRSEIMAWVKSNEDVFVDLIKDRTKTYRPVLVGGPFQGLYYLRNCRGRGVREFWARGHDWYLRKVAYARWAVYRIDRDGLGTFMGYASSETKARQGQIEAPA
jgi:hypothetical protein